MVESTVMEPVEGFALSTALDEEKAQTEDIRDRALHASRNLVMSTRGYAELLADGVTEPQTRAAWASQIVRHLDRLARLYDRLEALEATPASNAQYLPIGWLLRCAAREVEDRDDVRARQVDFAWDIATNPSIAASAAEMSAAFAAIIENAVEASPDGGVVVLRIEPDARSGWQLRVLDSGAGLSPDLRDDPTHAFISGKPGHVGLGLHLARTLLSRHGLMFTLDDRPEGGSVAIVRPFTQPAVEPGSNWS